VPAAHSALQVPRVSELGASSQSFMYFWFFSKVVEIVQVLRSSCNLYFSYEILTSEEVFVDGFLHVLRERQELAI